MENRGEPEQRNLIGELTRGRELARQLQTHLHTPSASHESREALLQRILSSYENALSMLKCGASTSTSAFAARDPPPAMGAVTESPRSMSESPRSEDSDREFKDSELAKDASRKRKALPRWTQQVQISPGGGLEGPLEDGYNWRKYGQKDILGAKFPRGYYRCTHRNVHGCLATKQVQRSDDDPTIFEVTYRGHHTCSQAPPPAPPPAVAPSLEIREIPTETRSADVTNPPPPQIPVRSQEILLNFRSGLTVMTQKMDSSFPFLPSSQSHAFLSPSPPLPLDGGLSGCFAPPSNDFPVATTRTGDFGGLTRNVQLEPESGSELAQIISAATSSSVAAASSRPVGSDNPFVQLDFDPNFTFDNPSFFP
uniref:WRKY transcription factor 28 n=1 Tax=Santalum album TaxID=35974 RepID=A0A650C2W9_SANAL|nr:WRKY transcription factor 28 [Santalum album]